MKTIIEHLTPNPVMCVNHTLFILFFLHYHSCWERFRFQVIVNIVHYIVHGMVLIVPSKSNKRGNKLLGNYCFSRCDNQVNRNNPINGRRYRQVDILIQCQQILHNKRKHFTLIQFVFSIVL